MKIQKFDTHQKVVIIAEIGNNHEGSFDVARTLIEKASNSNADAVKFQIFNSEYYVGKSNLDRFNRLKGFELSAAEFGKLADHAHQYGLAFIATPFDLESVDVTKSICDAIKISSGDNNFYPLIDAVAEVGKPTILSTGLIDLKELEKSYAILNQKLGHEDIGLLHCVTNYPVEPIDANIGAVRHLASSFHCEIGYSDHTIGEDACIAAVAAGARIIEKHFTLDHNYSDFRDHQLSANPDEMLHLCKRIREFETLVGIGLKKPSATELKIRSEVRRSIVLKKALPKGHILDFEDLAWVRPGGGLEPGREFELVGKRLIGEVGAGKVLSSSDLK